MSCEEFENKILDYQENQLSPAQRQEAENHLSGCADCRICVRLFKQLDAVLSDGVKVPTLSADFDRRLRERIQVTPMALSEAERAERRRQLHAEFETGMARIGRGYFSLGSMLNHLIWPALVNVVAWLVWLFISLLTTHLSTRSWRGLDPHLLPWLAISAVFLLVGMAEAFPRQRKFPGN